MKRSSNRGIHIWCPGLGKGAGGIQAVARDVVRAIRDLHPTLPIRVLSKNDTLLPDDPLWQCHVSITSASRSPTPLRTSAMAAMGLAAALIDRPKCIFSLHLNFLPAIRPLSKLLSIPYATMLHGIEAWSPTTASRHNSLTAADWFFPVSAFTRSAAVKQHSLDVRRMSLLPCTYDSAMFDTGTKPDYLLERYKLTLEQPVLLTVGRLDRAERYKGHRTVLAAMPQILKRFPSTRYVIAGTGNDLHELQCEVQELGLANSVTFAGFVPANEMPDYYRLCDVFVMPSKMEGFGIVFLEAMASGKPVIAGNQDGSADALDHGRLGALIPPEDPSSLAQATLAILDRTHSNILLLDPEGLKREVDSQFGFAAFKERLAAPLGRLLSTAEA